MRVEVWKPPLENESLMFVLCQKVAQQWNIASSDVLVLRGSYLVVVWVCPNESACRVDYTPLHYTSTFQQKNQPKYLECTKRHRENNEKLGWNFARSNRQNMRINGYQFSLFLGQKHKPSSFPQLCDLILLETVSPMCRPYTWFRKVRWVTLCHRRRH